MTLASVADLASLTVEVRRLENRLAALEARFKDNPESVLGRPRLADRVLQLAAKRMSFAGHELVRALDAEGMLANYRRPEHTAWTAILREVQRGNLRRVRRGHYAIN